MNALSLHDFDNVPQMTDAVTAARTAARAGENILLVGPPSLAQTMLARRLANAMGPLTDLETTWIRSEFDGLGLRFSPGTDIERPFRAPHHTVSQAAMSGTTVRVHRIDCAEMHAKKPRRCNCGRETVVRVGECHLARFGVLYLDELQEFGRPVIDTIVRTVGGMATGSPLLIANATPCPCGWQGSSERTCACTPTAIARHADRVRGFAARLDLTCRIRMPAITSRDILRMREVS